MTDPRFRRRSAIVAAVACFVVMGCTRTTTDTALPDEGEPATSSSQAADTTAPADDGPSALEWSSCVQDLECATLAVPLDHADPASPTIDLALIRRPAKDQANKVGSLVLNPGGPGGSGFDLIKNLELGDELEDSFDAVSWDPRGIGNSAELGCTRTAPVSEFRSLDSDPDDPAEQATIEAASKAIADDCAADDLALLQHSTTTDTAHDVEDIRAALGDPKLTYMGFSYGTQIGQEYARLYPDRVRAMVLDGVVDPYESIQELLRGQTATIDSTFSEQTLAQLDEVMAMAEREPLEGPEGTELTPGMISLAAIAASYYPDGEYYLDTATSSALNGDTDRLETLANSYIGQSSFPAYLAVTCTDTPFAPGVEAWNAFAEDLRTASPRFGAAVANELLPCAFWPVSPQRQPGGVTTAEEPILVVGTTGDAATPYEDAVRVAEGIPGAVLLTLDGEGHTAFGKSGCIDDAIGAYLVDLQTPAPDTVCKQD